MQILDDGRVLRLELDAAPSGGGPPVDLAALWLRDTCHCDRCRRAATNERRLDPTGLDPDLRIRSADRGGDALVVETTDGHRSVVPLRLLDRSRPERRPVASVVEPARMTVDELSSGVLDLLDRLAADGALVVTGVSPTDEGLRAVAGLLGPIHATNYGDTWTIDAVVDAVSEVESDRALAVHTDLPYRTDPPGVQLLLACRIDVTGGHSILVDGFAAADRLRRGDPGAFELLTRVPVEYPYVRDDVEIVARAPLIQLDGDGQVRVIRRAPDLMGAPEVVATETGDFYRALRVWWSLLDDPAATITVPLEPGELLVFDNHRVLHGRTAFGLGSSGRRLLRGCYVHRDDVASRHAVLRRRARLGRG